MVRCSQTRLAPESGGAHVTSSARDAPVQPLSVVDNSDISPTRLTFPLEAPYSSLSKGNGFFASFQAKRILHEPTGVLPRVLSRAALCPVLVPSRSCPVESRGLGAQQAPPSAEAPLPRRLPGLSSGLRSLVGCRASACSCTPLARGQKPAGSPQAREHRGLCLSQSAVRLRRDH